MTPRVTRSATKNLKKDCTNESKNDDKERKKAAEIVIESDSENEAAVDLSDGEYEPAEVKKRSTTRTVQTPKATTKKETKPRGKKVDTSLKVSSTATKVEPKKEPERLDEEDAVYYELDEKEMKEINHAFYINRPRDGDELLDADGLRTAIRSLGFEPRGDEIQKLVKKFANKKGKVNRDGFHRLMAHKYGTSPAMANHNNPKDEISRVFNLIDLDRTGFITLENLRSMAKVLNEELSDDELKEMIREADTDGDMQIDKEDFISIMKKTNLY